jgi:hypothetical protein
MALHDSNNSGKIPVVAVFLMKYTLSTSCPTNNITNRLFSQTGFYRYVGFILFYLLIPLPPPKHDWSLNDEKAYPNLQSFT